MLTLNLEFEMHISEILFPFILSTTRAREGKKLLLPFNIPFFHPTFRTVVNFEQIYLTRVADGQHASQSKLICLYVGQVDNRSYSF